MAQAKPDSTGEEINFHLSTGEGPKNFYPFLIHYGVPLGLLRGLHTVMATALGSCLVFMFKLHFQPPFLEISSDDFNKPSLIHYSLGENNVPETVLGSKNIMINKAYGSFLPLLRLHSEKNIRKYKTITIPTNKFYDGGLEYGACSRRDGT